MSCNCPPEGAFRPEKTQPKLQVLTLALHPELQGFRHYCGDGEQCKMGICRSQFQALLVDPALKQVALVHLRHNWTIGLGYRMREVTLDLWMKVLSALNECEANQARFELILPDELMVLRKWLGPCPRAFDIQQYKELWFSGHEINSVSSGTKTPTPALSKGHHHGLGDVLKFENGGNASEASKIASRPADSSRNSLKELDEEHKAVPLTGPRPEMGPGMQFQRLNINQQIGNLYSKLTPPTFGSNTQGIYPPYDPNSGYYQPFCPNFPWQNPGPRGYLNPLPASQCPMQPPFLPARPPSASSTKAQGGSGASSPPVDLPSPPFMPHVPPPSQMSGFTPGSGPVHDSQPNDGKPSALVVPKFGPSEDTDPTFRNASRMASVIYRPTTPDAQSPKGTPVGYREWEWVEEMSLDSSANDSGDDDADNFVVIR